jgi:hypothetical protein
MNRCLLASISTGLLLAGLLWAADEKPKPAPPLPPAATDPMDFQRDIQPILVKACLSCHCAAKQKGGVRLDDGAEAMKGGNAGAVIKPGDSARSRLIHVIGGLDPEVKMPPDEKKALSAAEIGKLRAWIDQGAKWPKDAVLTSKDATKLNHWSFQPIRRPALPPVANPAWSQRNGIDYFIQARLAKEQLVPNPEADRNTLVRRLALDLTGLPPMVEELGAVMNDASPDWYEKYVDRLLASPHYGERWGRHWLDLARYADSDGYEKDTGRPFAWRFRHWVIQALNANMPFDQFTIEQIAGDLLPPPVANAPGSPTVIEQKTATGFHRNTLTNKEGGVDQEQFRVEAVVDRVNTTGKVWLGITIGCCQCHDHKYDPFSQREYYQFLAFFNSDGEVDLAAPLPGEEDIYNRKMAEFNRKKAELDAALAAYKSKELPARQTKWEKDLRPLIGLASPAVPVLPLVEPPARTDKQVQALAGTYAKTDKKLIDMTKAVTDHAKTAPQQSKVMTLALNSTRKTSVLIRGDFLRPGVEVQASTPGIFPPLAAQPPPGVTKSNRLDLAKWLVEPKNPLTARVIVNWMWHKYFGRGIVATLEDFGTQGEKPSHPELLDWLASEFMASDAQASGGSNAPGTAGWNMKRMHKLIVMSATYRQSSALRPELAQRDPLNVLLARQTRQRLEAELLRDSALAASGLLVRQVGGPSVRPPQPAGISELTYAGSARWVESTGPDRYRRGLYTWFQRTSPYPMLMTFDAPDGNVCTVRRERTNTPLQALTLLNDTVFVECAQALGKRIIEDKPNADAKERIRHAVRLCLSREPSSGEMVRLERLYVELLSLCKAKPDEAAKLAGKMKVANVDSAELAAWIGVARTLMNLDEFVTRE